MRLTDQQLNGLMNNDTATVQICYHDIGMEHKCPKPGSGEVPVFVIRIVGHFLDGIDACKDDLMSDEIVSDHKLFSIDLPFHPQTLAGMTSKLSEAVIQALACEMLTGSTIQRKDLSEFLKWLGIRPDDGD